MFNLKTKDLYEKINFWKKYIFFFLFLLISIYLFFSSFLFVKEKNTPASNLYKRMGFSEKEGFEIVYFTA